MTKVGCAVIIYENHYLIAKRGPGRDEGFWEFPGGKMNSNESILECVERELYEEMNLRVTAVSEIFQCFVSNGNQDGLQLSFVTCVCQDFRPKLIEHTAIALVKKNDLINYQFKEGDMKFVNWIQREP